MTTRSFALTSLVAAIPGVAVVVLVIFGILAASGEIFGSVPLAITAVFALLCGVVAAVLPVVLFLKKTPAAAAPTPAVAGGTSGEFVADGSDDEIVAVDGDTGEILAVADGTSAEFVEVGSEEFEEPDSAEFVEAESAEFEAAADDDPFADFAEDDDEDDDFFADAKK